MMKDDLFGDIDPRSAAPRVLAPGAHLLPGRALGRHDDILALIAAVAEHAPFRHMTTPGGFSMSVAMTNCGAVGWVTDRKGYRYAAADPQTERPWPALPDWLAAFAREVAADCGFAGFAPDACLINRYQPGARMSLHQDRDERDLTQPILSISLGLPARFLFGGNARSDPQERILLSHGDVLVWGGPARLRFHGIAPLKDGHHPRTGPYRYNLTFRVAR